MSNAAAKISMLNNSLRCFVFGLLALLPVIGLPFAIAALCLSGRVRVQEKLFWNAARPYRILGVLYAGFGVVFWSFILILVIFRVKTPAASDN